MKKALVMAVVGMAFVVTSANAQVEWYARGAFFSNWAAEAGNQLLDDGTGGDAVGGDGIFSRMFATDVVAGDYEFKVGLADWSESHPGSNLWATLTSDNQMVLVTFDTNTYVDGWFPATNIVWSDALRPETIGWSLVGAPAEMGAWAPESGFDATDNAGMWEAVINLTVAEDIEYKWTADGVWSQQQFGFDGYGSNAANIMLTIETPGDHSFGFNPATGRGYQNEGPVPTEDTSWTRLKELYGAR